MKQVGLQLPPVGFGLGLEAVVLVMMVIEDERGRRQGQELVAALQEQFVDGGRRPLGPMLNSLVDAGQDLAPAQIILSADDNDDARDHRRDDGEDQPPTEGFGHMDLDANV